MTDLDAFCEARHAMVDALVGDLIGTDADDLLNERPLSRFVTGVLYPRAEAKVDQVYEESDADSAETDPKEVFDPPVALSHVRYPSAIGLSLAVGASVESLHVHVSGARYRETEDGWVRQPEAKDVDVHLGGGTGRLTPTWIVDDALQIDTVVREPKNGTRSVTLALVNTLVAGSYLERDSASWFQIGMEVTCGEGFLDRPVSGSSGLDDEDVASNRLLFRGARNLAVGHGCAVDWQDDDPVTTLSIAFIPRQEVHRSRTDVEGISLPMSAFSVERGGLDRAEALIAAYRRWIEEQERRAAVLEDEALRATADDHVARAGHAAERMLQGVEFLRAHSHAARAFALMNRAMRDQRNKQEFIRSGADPREQYWRPFQLAFILMNIEGLSERQSTDRDVADLLWFPTGGGKTEAYLGLIGFTILLRRLSGPGDGGVSVIMRYTLRLLTLQQFERAAGLICALEVIRRTALPDSPPISVGLWVGQAATPNYVADARKRLLKIKRGEPVDTENPMQLTYCPWCGARLDADDYIAEKFPVERLTIRCPKPQCEFHDGIPAFVTDQDVYRERPSLVIGTVDKFAMLAWREQAQTLFSCDGANSRPDLIVQDELHLISGPLGTMVGLYETAVDAACTSEKGRPKLVASTATIRRATTQMRAVFDRTAAQFPPPGLDADDSFFAQIADREVLGTREYVGVLAQGVTHTYLMVRVYAALLQAGKELDAPDEVRDAYWTLLGYFNSLRVLGGAAIQSTDDVPAQMRVIARRHGHVERELTEDPAELTSRASSSDIPKHLDRLGKSYGGSDKPFDVVLATNMISVGLDVDRLGLMTVMGQPQATAEYIQATSRVGRNHPGLVVVIYNGTRSRDLSHYESFGTYHRALYRQVEPNSATPFSPRARDRGLHGCLVAYARTTVPALASDMGAGALCKDPELLDPVVEGILDRVERVDSEQVEATAQQLRALKEVWEEAGEHLKYPGWRRPEGALLVEAGNMLSDDHSEPVFPVSDPPWATLTSLRDVDAVSSMFMVSERKGKS